VTRSGGNAFSGSLRENVSNPAWINETPLERTNNVVHKSVVGKTHEATFGGPLSKDRIWFFGAGPLGNFEHAEHVFADRSRLHANGTEPRGEAKVTARLRLADTVSATYINNSTEQINTSGVPATAILDSNVLVTRQLPNRLMVVNYSGVAGSSYFATLQYSQKKQQFQNNGGTSSSLANSPFVTLGATAPGGSSITRHISTPRIRNSGTTSRSPAASRGWSRRGALVAMTSKVVASTSFPRVLAVTRSRPPAPYSRPTTRRTRPASPCSRRTDPRCRCSSLAARRSSVSRRSVARRSISRRPRSMRRTGGR
jgi:hypothetical protein